MSSVGIEFPRQQERVRKIRENALALGPHGAFLAAITDQALKRAAEAQSSGDVQAILRSYQELKDFQD